MAGTERVLAGEFWLEVGAGTGGRQGTLGSIPGHAVLGDGKHHPKGPAGEPGP